jgi:hypothetical protein
MTYTFLKKIKNSEQRSALAEVADAMSLQDFIKNKNCKKNIHADGSF